MNAQRTPLTKTRAREILEDARMDIARLMAVTVENQQQLHALIGITGELYEGILDEEAPVFELQTRIARSA